MALTPLSKLKGQLGPGFSAGHDNEDVALIEPYKKGRDYSLGSKIHSKALVGWVAKDGKPVSIGRDARATLLLDHPAVSRLHAVVAYPQGWKAMDRSSNGSWLDGSKMPKDQAVDMPYGGGLRLGRAVVIRIFSAGQFLQYAGGTAPATPAAPAAPAAPAPGAAAYPFPTAPAPPASPPAAPASVEEFAFEFGDDLPPVPAAPTVRMNRSDLSHAPAPPPGEGAPPAEPKKDDIDFEFDFDFG